MRILPLISGIEMQLVAVLLPTMGDQPIHQRTSITCAALVRMGDEIIDIEHPPPCQKFQKPVTRRGDHAFGFGGMDQMIPLRLLPLDARNKFRFDQVRAKHLEDWIARSDRNIGCSTKYLHFVEAKDTSPEDKLAGAAAGLSAGGKPRRALRTPKGTSKSPSGAWVAPAGPSPAPVGFYKSPAGMCKAPQGLYVAPLLLRMSPPGPAAAPVFRRSAPAGPDAAPPGPYIAPVFFRAPPLGPRMAPEIIRPSPEEIQLSRTFLPGATLGALTGHLGIWNSAAIIPNQTILSSDSPPQDNPDPVMRAPSRRFGWTQKPPSDSSLPLFGRQIHEEL